MRTPGNNTHTPPPPLPPFQPSIPANNHIEPGENITPITPKKAGPVDSTRVAEEVKGGQGTPVPP